MVSGCAFPLSAIPPVTMSAGHSYKSGIVDRTDFTPAKLLGNRLLEGRFAVFFAPDRKGPFRQRLAIQLGERIVHNFQDRSNRLLKMPRQKQFNWHILIAAKEQH
jgi:hypothetical protein